MYKTPVQEKHKISVDKMSVDKMYEDKMSVDKMFAKVFWRNDNKQNSYGKQNVLLLDNMSVCEMSADKMSYGPWHGTATTTTNQVTQTIDI